MKTTNLILPNYSSLLKEIKNHLAQTQAIIEQTVIRKKVEMAWNVGQSISKHIGKNPQLKKNSYGEKLFDKLEGDTGIATRMLYKMYAFFKTYPSLPKDSEKLNWNHYQLLSGIKKKEERKYLEDLVKEKNLTVIDLRKTIKKKKAPSSDVTPTLAPRRGQLGYYKLFKPSGETQNYIDCGFKIYREMPKKLPKGVKIVTGTNARQAYTYKGCLTRIVDGDTLHVTLDVGFGIKHEENLRLRGINAAEASARGGKKATEGLKKILKNQDSFIVRTSSTDMYNRYLADIFLNDGTYLNQLLLDKKLAVLF